MRHRLGVRLVPLLGAMVMLAGMNAIGADPSPHAPPAEPPTVWLKGAFGRVAGTSPAAPAVAPPDDRALDSWMRGAPLELSTDLAPTEPIEIWVVSRPADGEGREELLSTGATSFDGPDHPGLNVVTASVTTESHGPSQHAWLVETPDRSGGPELLLDIPGPRLELVSASGSVSGEPGHGCYAYLCVHVGYRPPLETLEVLPVAIGETLGLHLDDGSAMSGWTGTLEPLGTFATAEPARAAATFGDGARAAPRLDGLEVPAAGEWLLELRADFDRERGWQWFLYRLMAE